MNTFLPYPDLVESARCLDRMRLGQQRVEAWQVLQTLLGRPTGHEKHPAVLMWRGSELLLWTYGIAVCEEWSDRGNDDGMLVNFRRVDTAGLPMTRPAWLGDDRVHSSHRRALLTKDWLHYSRFGWTEEPFPSQDLIRYHWPVRS